VRLTLEDDLFQLIGHTKSKDKLAGPTQTTVDSRMYAVEVFQYQRARTDCNYCIKLYMPYSPYTLEIRNMERGSCPIAVLYFAMNTVTLTLLVGQHSSVDISPEYDNICSWSVRNKLTINTGKTKEIVFRRPASRHLNIPLPFQTLNGYLRLHYWESTSHQLCPPPYM